MMKKWARILLIMVVFSWGPLSIIHADSLVVGHFSDLVPGKEFPENWKPMTFSGIDRHTRYTLIRDEGRTVIQADSRNAASGLIRFLRVDPADYPVIQWQWKIDHVLEKGDASTRQGDDYAARIYVAFAFDPDQASWWERARHKSAAMLSNKEVPGSALNYIWANKAPKDSILTNPYLSESMMVAVQSGDTLAGRWIVEKRNIVADYRQAFGRPPPEIIGIGIMTDTDDTGEETIGYYGDVRIFVLNENPW
ncbi:DUF3047 domain-containing protein [Desulfotignum phosphitoxidans]|uniref:DUF3047 domain-containing protein n=1 Tax=Desulfotignum phosphitoxidans DSM 13687 TaxID=1286635 RepID=S0G3W9_9BACT|nr:DUF3047 domain-containing protein [Desulfotignum phosphitoxidans]EMS81620.1 hypothetical protein DUF3047 [Desulfotignum phosphitoxidans DSM 13687]